MPLVAFDIETCPLPEQTLTAAQQRRVAKDLAYKQRSRPDLSEKNANRLVRSVHPFLGWICCISAVSGAIDAEPNTPVSWTAETPEEEADLLRSFWEAVAGFPDRTRWVTFNGKRFDVPFIEARSALHGVAPTRSDLTNTYPYRHTPHADLARIWPVHYSLEELCVQLGIPSPKDEFDGSQVAEHVAKGRLDAVAAYCERDVVATYECMRRVEATMRL